MPDPSISSCVCMSVRYDGGQTRGESDMLDFIITAIAYGTVGVIFGGIPLALVMVAIDEMRG